MIDIEVPPTTLGLVDDANGGRLPGQIRHVPRVRGQRLATATAVIRARRRTDHLTLHQQLQGELLLVVPPADEEGEEAPLDLEGR